MLLNKPLTCFINTDEEFDQELQETVSKWSAERIEVGGLNCHRSLVEQGQTDVNVYILGIYPNLIGVEHTWIYFEVLALNWLPKYFLTVLMDATVENGNVMNVVDPVEGDVYFGGSLISSLYKEAGHTWEDLLAESFDSQFWSIVQGGTSD
jgi:hypothetical protein